MLFHKLKRNKKLYKKTTLYFNIIS